MAEHKRDTNWYSRIEGREVAIVRGVVTAVVAIALIWGVDLTEWGDKITSTADILGTLVFTVLGPLWIRSGVSPADEVAVQVRPDVGAVAGPAAPVTTGAAVDYEVSKVV